MLHQERAWGHGSGGRSTPASQDAIKSWLGAGCALQRDWLPGDKELSPFQPGLQQPAAPQASRTGAYQPSPDTLSPCLHPSSSPGLGDISGKQPWMESICGFGQGVLEGSRALGERRAKSRRGIGVGEEPLQGSRVRNDPQGENEVETPGTEDAHTAAKGELHIYF